MADSVGVHREAREVIAAVLTALAEAGIGVGRWEQVGWLHPKLGNFWEAKEHENPAALESAGWVPVYRRVDGATGEQT